MTNSRRVFVFGAGASHGARNPTPPLGDTLHIYVRGYLKRKWDDLKQLEDGNGVIVETTRRELDSRLEKALSYESLLNNLLQQGETDLAKKMNYIMACALTLPIHNDPKVDDAFIEKPDVYDDLLETLKQKGSLEKTCLVTLNYDCLLERAIRRCLGPRPKEFRCLCAHVNYRLPHSTDGIEVLKLHGSINWVRDPKDDGSPLNSNSIPLYFVGHDGTPSYCKIAAVDSPIGHDYDDLILAHYA